MASTKPIPEGQKQLSEKLVAEITDAFYHKAEKENLDPSIINSVVKDVQDIFSGKGAKRKQCFLCGQS